MTIIPHDELQCDAWPPREKGGQHVGTGPHGVKLTRLPSGITVTVTHERSQHLNRRIALDAMEGALTSPGYCS